MPNPTKVKFINKKGEWVTETCHDILTCREHKEALNRTRKITQANPEILMLDEDELETVDSIMSRMETGNNFADLEDTYIDYKEILERQGVDIIAFESFGDYQGDYAAIVKKDGKVGFTVIGYGSCSGCDALEALKDNYNVNYYPYDENEEPLARNEEQTEELHKFHNALQEYADQLESNIEYGSYEELKEKITGADNRIKWYSKYAGFKEAQNDLMAQLHKAFN